MFGASKKRGGLNATVAKTLAGMGVDPQHAEKKLREDRGRVDPKVAKVLESMGMTVRPEDLAEVVNEEGDSPLNMPGQQPMVDPNKGQANGMQGQNNGQSVAKGQGQKPGQQPDVKLKKPATTMQTLQDVSDKMTEVTANIKTVDLLVQALTENKASDKSIKAHRLTLQGPIQAIVNSVNDLKKLVE